MVATQAAAEMTGLEMEMGTTATARTMASRRGVRSRQPLLAATLVVRATVDRATGAGAHDVLNQVARDKANEIRTWTSVRASRASSVAVL